MLARYRAKIGRYYTLVGTARCRHARHRAVGAAEDEWARHALKR